MIPGLRTAQFAGRRIAVIGMKRTGRSTAEVLHRLGAQVVLSDAAPAEALGEDYELASTLPVELRPEASPIDALEKAELVVPSPGVPRDAPVLKLALRLGIPILSEVEIAYRLARCPILAVTGTNGKSTTAAWLALMLEKAGMSVRLAGNISADELKCTLIDAAEASAEGDVIVAEISSFQLEWVERFRPRVGILTNIRRDHLDRHGTLAEYIRCKARLFAAQRPGDFAVLNAVNAPARRIARDLRSRVVWFDRSCSSEDNRAFVCQQRLGVRIDGQEHLLVRVEDLSLPGEHNLENALAASAAAIAFGVDSEPVSEALRTFSGLPHRSEPVAEIEGVLYINASMTTNVDAAIHVLKSAGRPVVLIAGGRAKHEDYEPLGVAIARYAHHAVLIGEAAEKIQECAEKAGFRHVSRASDMDEAVAVASRLARPGDAVILAPACGSFDMYANFEERGQAFRSAVAKLRDTVVPVGGGQA